MQQRLTSLGGNVVSEYANASILAEARSAADQISNQAFCPAIGYHDCQSGNAHQQ
jgi:hypothetical protein